MKTCAYCGRENDDAVNNCRECGTEFITVESAPPSFVRSYGLRVLVAVSGPLAAFWSIGLAVDLTLGFDPSPFALAVGCLGLVWGSLFLAVRQWPSFLSLEHGPAPRTLLRFFVICLLGCYCAFALLIFILGLSAVWLTRSRNTEFYILVSLAALWLPIWLAPPAASLATWLRFRPTSVHAHDNAAS